MMSVVMLPDHLLQDMSLRIIVDSRPLPYTVPHRAERQLRICLSIFIQIRETAQMIGVRHE
jgi:hypothetical protein